MNIGSLIASVATKIYNAGITLVQLGATINGVYLIGGALAYPFFVIGSNVAIAGANLGVMAPQWDNFYNMVITQLGDNPIIKSLIYWGQQLINFISNPKPIIRNILHELFPRLEELFVGTVAFLRPYIQTLLDVLIPWWRDLQTKIITFLGEWVQDWNTFRANPARWVYDRLRSFSGMLGALLLDPENWLRDRIRTTYPDVWSFIQDPKGFILLKLVEALELFFDRYLVRLMKITEKILSAIF
jgi:phage-related protein